MRDERQRWLGRLLAAALVAVPPSCAPAVLPPDALGAVCGNGVLDAGEECDDGNASNDDGCLVSCYAPVRFVSSDPHVHSQGCLESTPPSQLLQMLAAEGIELGAALVWGVGYEEDRPLFTGADHPASTGGRILHYDLEVSHFAASRTGHLVVLGLRSLDFSPNPFRSPKSGLSIPAWAKSQDERVVVGMAHGQVWLASTFRLPPDACCMPWEFPIQAARGGVSFLGTERRGKDEPPIDDGTFVLWRTLLNSGFRIALMGSSDYPCTHRAIDDTTPRSDVIVSGPLTYEAWLEGIRRGRTVVTLGARHGLNLRVNGAPLGSEVATGAGEVLLVSLESEAPERTRVELLINGAVAESVELPAGRQVATLRFGLSASSWLSARTPRAATSAVYVVVDGKPIRASADDSCYLMRYVDHLSGLVSSGQIDLGEDQAFALEAYTAARAEFEKRWREAGGVSCF